MTDRGDTMKRLIVSAAVAVAMLVPLAGPASVAANNDPHRSYFPSTPFDLDTTFCAFPAHVDFAFQAEYGTVSALHDGSTVIKMTGPLFATVSNAISGKSETVNASGKGTFTFLADGATVIGDFRGAALLYAPNHAQLGFPSNMAAVAGIEHITQTLAPDGTFRFTGLGGQYRILTDICAAVA